MKIKNILPWIKIAAAAGCVLLIILFGLWQLNTSLNLGRELSQKTSALKEAQAASQSLKKLQDRISELERSEKIINIRVPLAEKYPFELIRTLTAIAQRAGLRKAVFSLKDENTGGDTAPAGYPAGDLTNRPKPAEIEMNFEGTYSQLVRFLERLRSLERVVVVQGIKIERKKEILPCQQISLRLITYTFSGKL